MAALVRRKSARPSILIRYGWKGSIVDISSSPGVIFHSKINRAITQIELLTLKSDIDLIDVFFEIRNGQLEANRLCLYRIEFDIYIIHIGIFIICMCMFWPSEEFHPALPSRWIGCQNIQRLIYIYIGLVIMTL